jgi:hypothetical protein
MDARAAESPVMTRKESWLQRERTSGRFYEPFRRRLAA